MYLRRPGRAHQGEHDDAAGHIGAAAKLALLIVLLQGVAVQAADIKVLNAGAAIHPR